MKEKTEQSDYQKRIFDAVKGFISDKKHTKGQANSKTMRFGTDKRQDGPGGDIRISIDFTVLHRPESVQVFSPIF
jgi:hypothetical protein